jgi:hypothetical protein
VPPAIPVTTPVNAFTVATPMAAADQLPPATVLVRGVDAFSHTDRTPAIGPGEGLTVKNFVAIQPEGRV